jgi:hypothetical protein
MSGTHISVRVSISDAPGRAKANGAHAMVRRHNSVAYISPNCHRSVRASGGARTYSTLHLSGVSSTGTGGRPRDGMAIS